MHCLSLEDFHEKANEIHTLRGNFAGRSNLYELTVTEAAKMLGISRQSLNKIIHEKSDITPEMSFRIAKVFGGTTDIWANLQTKFNLHLAAEKTKELKLKPYYFQHSA